MLAVDDMATEQPVQIGRKDDEITRDNVDVEVCAVLGLGFCAKAEASDDAPERRSTRASIFQEILEDALDS
tara:strand:- start:1140 stop:1352 length:213 start_codon:yes stop_codon:yes gene_type:complete